jgi:hypothetical protein
MAEEKENSIKEIEVPIEWYVPESLVSRYATNMIVQHSEHEFILSFFDTPPPLILGESKLEDLQKIKSIRAICVAQIIVAKDRMQGFVNAMQENLAKARAKTKTAEPKA